MHVYLYYKKKKSGLTTASSIHNTPSYTLWSETPKIRLWYFLTTGDCYSTKTFRIADETFKNVKRIIYLIGLITAILYYGYTNSSLFKFPIPISYYVKCEWIFITGLMPNLNRNLFIRYREHDMISTNIIVHRVNYVYIFLYVFYYYFMCFLLFIFFTAY